MKIFIVCNSLGAGGAERVGVNLANGFVNHGHEVYIITDLFQEAAYPVDEKVTVLPMTKLKLGKVKKYTQTVRNIRKYAKRYHPDVVIGMMHLSSFLPLVALAGMHIPVVLTIHHALTSRGYKISLRTKVVDRLSPILYSHTTVLTQIDYDILKKFTKRLSVMPNPLTFSPCAKMETKQKVLLAAGRVDVWHYKGFDVLMKAWNLVAHRHPEWQLMLAGQGSEETLNFLKSLLTDDVAKVNTVFLGYSKDMLSLYGKASIYVLSSRSEGLPMVLIEAMSQGCAPVATANMGRTAEIITSAKEGVICKAEDVENLARGIDRMIADEAYRHEVQVNAIERSRFYSQEHIVRMWEEVIGKCWTLVF